MSTEEIYQHEWYLANKARKEATHEIGQQIIELAGHLNAANYRLLMLIAEYDRRKGWGGDGATQSCAHWLNWNWSLSQRRCHGIIPGLHARSSWQGRRRRSSAEGSTQA